jgi:hypothetical protein
VTGLPADHRGRDPERGAGKGLAWRLRQPVVPMVKAGLRGYGVATAGGRSLPDFLVIGAKRGGSTSLYRNLVRTPGVLPLFPRVADVKGTYFFDVEHARGERWYRSHFPSAGVRRRAEARGPVAVGEASPYYLSHPHAAARAAGLVPDARIVAVLRDPVARAHSHYQERHRQGIETLPTFAAAVEAEDERLRGEVEHMLEEPGYVSWNHLNFGYLAQSDYAAGLRRWLAVFPAEQVLVLRSEDLYADDAAVLARVRGFLGLEAKPPAETKQWNRTGSSELDPGLARELDQRLAPSVAALSELLGWPADPWPADLLSA